MIKSRSAAVHDCTFDGAQRHEETNRRQCVNVYLRFDTSLHANKREVTE